MRFSMRSQFHSTTIPSTQTQAEVSIKSAYARASGVKNTQLPVRTTLLKPLTHHRARAVRQHVLDVTERPRGSCVY